ncbi:MAG: hypothetical protein IIX15_03010, partial [Clostridia bacterium]|nr:hypothetical protein [Clostridia bacterium]
GMSGKKVLYDALGLCCCLIPPIACTCTYFPVWEQTVGTWAMVGGTVAIIVIVAFIVLSKYLRSRIKSPSPVVISLCLWLFFVLVERTVEGLKMVSFWLFIGSLAGAVFFWLADRTERRKG